MITVVLFALSVFLYFAFKHAYKKPKNFPPGPPSLPVYGGFWIVQSYSYNDLASAFRKIGDKYKTKVVGLFMGPAPTVVVNDPKLIKEVFLREEFDGRMDIIISRLRSYWKKLGVIFTDGYFWHIQRRFSLRYLRDYGFGRRDTTLEAVVASEINDMIDLGLNGPKFLKEKDIVTGNLVHLPLFFSVPFINGILQVLSQTTVARDKFVDLWEISRGAIMFQRGSNDMGGALSITPWLKDVLPSYSGYNDLLNGSQIIREYFERLVTDAVETHDDTYNRHFLDIYLTKMKKETETYDDTTFSMDQLILTCTDYTLPAASTVQYVLTFLVERLLLQPEIQNKIHEEIDRVVGRDRMPTLDDRPHMPYTEACIRETLRYDTFVPLSVPHRAMTDTKLAGYDIPEGSMVSPNLTMLHTDKEIWGDPECFRPDRFIRDGKLNVTSDKSLPFGAGRRMCPGETFSRQTMFQVFSAFMQAFTVNTANGKPLLKPARRIQGILTTIPEFWVKITPRSPC